MDNIKILNILTLILISIIYLCIRNYLIIDITPEFISENFKNPFVDWKIIRSANECYHLGYDVYVENPCDYKNRVHAYGSFFLKINFTENLIFYWTYIPFIFISFFLIIISNHFDLKNKSHIILFFLFIFSPTTLLAIERANIDIIIFLILILICYYRSNILSLVLVSISSYAKLYPVFLCFIFIFNKKNNFKKGILFLISFITIFLIFIFLDLDNIIKVLSGQKLLNENSFFINFSYHAIPLLIFKKFQINYVLTYSVLFIFSILVGIYFFRHPFRKFFVNNFHLNDYPSTLFLIGLNLIVFCYIFFHNFYYREIFLFCMFPYILSEVNSNKELKKFLNFIILKYFISFILSYIILFKPLFFVIFLEFTTDLIFMLILLIVVSSINYRIIKKNLFNKKQIL